jgi:hypothetical protein
MLAVDDVRLADEESAGVMPKAQNRSKKGMRP